jgi:hypothetical protein
MLKIYTNKRNSAVLACFAMNINTLTSMGYSVEESEEALAASKDNLELAIELLCNKGHHSTYIFIPMSNYTIIFFLNDFYRRK